jgi:hypothetical protein
MGSICGWFALIGIIIALYQIMLSRRYVMLTRGLLRMLHERITTMPLAQRDGLNLKVASFS